MPPRICPRCGAELPVLRDLAFTALHARRALDSSRLAIPGGDVAHAVRSLARGLACMAQLCPPTIKKETP